MESRDVRARQIQRDIREILLREWDPIGIRDEPRAQDEYDAYVGGVYRLLASDASPQVLAEHLAQIEGEQMGFTVPPARLLAIATKLLALNVKAEITDKAV